MAENHNEKLSFRELLQRRNSYQNKLNAQRDNAQNKDFKNNNSDDEPHTLTNGWQEDSYAVENRGHNTKLSKNQQHQLSLKERSREFEERRAALKNKIKDRATSNITAHEGRAELALSELNAIMDVSPNESAKSTFHTTAQAESAPPSTIDAINPQGSYLQVSPYKEYPASLDLDPNREHNLPHVPKHLPTPDLDLLAEHVATETQLASPVNAEHPTPQACTKPTPASQLAPESLKALEAPVAPDTPVACEAPVAPDATVASEAAVACEATVAPDVTVAPEAAVASKAPVTPDAPVAAETMVASEVNFAPETSVNSNLNASVQAPAATVDAITVDAVTAPASKALDNKATAQRKVAVKKTLLSSFGSFGKSSYDYAEDEAQEQNAKPTKKKAVKKSAWGWSSFKSQSAFVSENLDDALEGNESIDEATSSRKVKTKEELLQESLLKKAQKIKEKAARKASKLRENEDKEEFVASFGAYTPQNMPVYDMVGPEDLGLYDNAPAKIHSLNKIGDGVFDKKDGDDNSSLAHTEGSAEDKAIDDTLFESLGLTTLDKLMDQDGKGAPITAKPKRAVSKSKQSSRQNVKSTKPKSQAVSAEDMMASFGSYLPYSSESYDDEAALYDAYGEDDDSTFHLRSQRRATAVKSDTANARSVKGLARSAKRSRSDKPAPARVVSMDESTSFFGHIGTAPASVSSLYEGKSKDIEESSNDIANFLPQGFSVVERKAQQGSLGITEVDSEGRTISSAAYEEDALDRTTSASFGSVFSSNKNSDTKKRKPYKAQAPKSKDNTFGASDSDDGYSNAEAKGGKVKRYQKSSWYKNYGDDDCDTDEEPQLESDVGKTYNYMVGLLSRREYSAKELTSKCRTRFTPEAIEEALAKLKDMKYQSDERYASMLVRSVEFGHYGPQRLKAKASQKGIDRELIDESINEVDWDSHALKTLVKRYGDKPLAFAERNKALAYLSRRGFDYDTCLRALERLNNGDIDDI